MSGEVGCVGSKKTDKVNILTLKSLWNWRQDTSAEPVLIESAVLYEMAAHLVYDICRLQINNFRLLFADCK